MRQPRHKYDCGDAHPRVLLGPLLPQGFFFECMPAPIVMPNIVMASIVMACIVMVSIVMPV